MMFTFNFMKRFPKSLFSAVCGEGLLIISFSLLTVGCSSSVSEYTDSNSSLHNQGKACLNCHGSTIVSDYTFTSGGTVFTTLHAADDNTSAYAKGYMIQLKMSGSGEVVSYLPRLGCGNSHTFTSIDTSFTARVIDENGTVVNSSNLFSHGTGKLNCNSCHTAEGTHSAPGRIVNYN